MTKHCCYMAYAAAILVTLIPINVFKFKARLYRIWCAVHTLGDTSAFVNPADQLLLTTVF